jgi:hypothetical protein
MTKTEMSTRRDPIREAPLREPGQSLREQLQSRILDATIPWLAVTILAWATVLVEWVRWQTSSPYLPGTFAVIAVVISLLAVWKIGRACRELPQWKLGLKGERAVGQFLQATLLPRGYVVIHDVCIDDFNIDHAVIGPGGVFAIEVKTRSKSRRG